MEIRGKSVLVTGGAVRVGAEICRAFAAAGARITIHCSTSRAAAEALAAALPGTGHRVLAADFTLPGAAEALFAAAGRVDILVNNASVYRLPGGDTPANAAVYRAVNLLAPYALLRLAVAQPGPGAVVNVLDQAVLARNPGESGAYLASRRRLAALTFAAARRYAPRDWRINAVAPGPMIPPRGLENSRMIHTLRSVPLGRPVAPGDLAAAILFLAGCDSVTGAILPVDGGRRLHR